MKKQLAPLTKYLNDLVSRNILPGGITCLAEKGLPRILIPFGFSVTSPQRIQVHADTIYDTASLTKPLITTTLVLMLMEKDAFPLETTLSSVYSSCPADKTEITISDLLCHSSGIPDWFPLYAVADDLDGFADKILNIPLASEIGTKVIYSCLNFILLADIIRKFTGKSFMQASKDMIFDTLQLERSFLGKSSHFSKEEIAATELDSATETEKIKEFDLTYAFRKGVIWGETHDCNSFSAGGSAGNAGLFTTATEALLLSEQYTHRSKLLGKDTRDKLVRNRTPFGPQHRTYGWQLASSPESSAGDSLSPSSIGHTGFTGTSIWHDPDIDLTYILLSNRIHPSARNINMNEIRRNIHQLLKVAYSEMS